MPKVKLDAQFALTAYCPPDRRKVDFWDDGTVCKGLVLEVRASVNGRSQGKTWYLRYQDRYGKQRQHKIGRYEDVGWEQVRKAARRLRSEVTLGGDPAEAKAALKTIPTYAELSAQHLAHAKTYQRAYSTTELYVRRHIIPRWGRVRVSEINRRDVALWLAEKDREGLKPATVEKIKAIFGRSFELALQWDIPGVVKNPARGIKRPPINNARTRSLNAAEVKRLLEAAAKSRNPQLANVISLLLYTGARVSELLGAEWQNVDLERRTWFIPMSKTGRSRHVPLSQAAMDVIERLPRFKGCPYLLVNPKTRRPFGDIKNGWHKARDDAGLKGLNLHDLRHAAASAMVSAGISLYAVGKILGHASHASTQRYGHLAADTLMAAVEAGASRLNVAD